MASASAARVLVADDQADVLEALRLLLRQTDLSADFVNSPAAVLERLRMAPYELLLLDLNYARDTTSGAEGLELLADVRAHDPALPVVVMTGWGTIETAVEAMRRGARSFVQKPWDNHALVGLLTREIEDARAARLRDARHLRDERDARLIQRSLLPQALPSLAGCDIAAAWRPADGFGGDCYDALAFGDDVIGLSIADVAGKGLSAALLMSNFQAAVRAFAQPEVQPATVCGNVNRLLCGHMVSGRFVTCCYLRVDCRGRTLTYANAGHNPPLLLRNGGGVESLSTGGTVLGVFAGSAYAEATLTLEPGDRLLLYTDGITEALAADGQEFGTERLVASALREPRETAAVMTGRIMDDLLAFTGGPLQDDATVMCLVIGEGCVEGGTTR